MRGKRLRRGRVALLAAITALAGAGAYVALAGSGHPAPAGGSAQSPLPSDRPGLNATVQGDETQLDAPGIHAEQTTPAQVPVPAPIGGAVSSGGGGSQTTKVVGSGGFSSSQSGGSGGAASGEQTGAGGGGSTGQSRLCLPAFGC